MLFKHPLLLTKLSALNAIAENNFLNRNLPIQTRLKLCQKVTETFKQSGLEALCMAFLCFEQEEQLGQEESSDALAFELEQITSKKGAAAFLSCESKKRCPLVQLLRRCNSWLEEMSHQAAELNEKVLKECKRKNIPKNGPCGEEVFADYHVCFSYDEIIKMQPTEDLICTPSSNFGNSL